MNNIDENDIFWNEDGLAPAIVQDIDTGEVLMLAYMNRTSLERTLETNETWFYSRSRQQLWHKGETSGNTQQVVELSVDCDKDTILIKVKPDGPACHTGENTCFYTKVVENEYKKSNKDMLYKVYSVIQDRKENPVEGSYTNYLLEKGVDKICKKIGEESAETIIAAKNNSKEELIYEASDLLYHLNVLLVNQGVSLDEIMDELASRYGKVKE